MTVTFDTLGARYGKLFELLGERKAQVLAFRDYIERETSWLTSPASTRFHLNIERGLLLHSVGVAYNALGIRDLLAQDIPDESIVIAALFHDLGKVGYPGKPYYLRNDVQWEITKRNMTYKVNPEATTMNLAVRSLYLISNRVELTEDEAQAIVAHDGIYPVSGGVNNLDYHHKECRLQMIVHFADKWTAAVDEEGRR
jgi:HD domain.